MSTEQWENTYCLRLYGLGLYCLSTDRPTGKHARIHLNSLTVRFTRLNRKMVDYGESNMERLMRTQARLTDLHKTVPMDPDTEEKSKH